MKKNSDDIFKAWVGMIRSHQIFLDRVEGDLKEAHMPPLSWYDILLEINRAPDKQLRLQDIAERILLAKNNVTRLVDRLEKEKLVIRRKCQRDGRGVYAYITPAGEDLLKSMWGTYETAVIKHFGEILSKTEIETLIKIRKKL